MKLHGKELEIYNGAQRIASVQDVSLDLTQDAADSTDRDDNGWKSKLGGYKSWTAQLTGVKIASDATQDALFSALTGGSLLTVNLYPNHKVSGQPVFSGTALVTKYSYKAPNQGLQTIDVSFESSGSLTEGVTP